MRYCNICGGKIVEIDQYGLEEECELCGTIYSLKPMESKADECDE